MYNKYPIIFTQEAPLAFPSFSRERSQSLQLYYRQKSVGALEIIISALLHILNVRCL